MIWWYVEVRPGWRSCCGSWWCLCGGEEQSGMRRELLPGPLRESVSASWRDTRSPPSLGAGHVFIDLRSPELESTWSDSINAPSWGSSEVRWCEGRRGRCSRQTTGDNWVGVRHGRKKKNKSGVADRQSPRRAWGSVLRLPVWRRAQMKWAEWGITSLLFFKEVFFQWSLWQFWVEGELLMVYCLFCPK